ncbi:MAG: hypothetical protein NTU88_11200, partial [Armatimonadetes bacterium]|nr:hypothetical protein [Armatimonadota bacterium]
MQSTLLILLLICGISSSTQAANQSESPVAIPQSGKAYSPFDEPRPKIPQEILSDKRLDQKVKVFVKSKNMKQLFTDLRAKTGVKITAARELWSERPIIYFHSRRLRDVMTEVSGLYGYRWLITGKPGAYEYEMYEDIRHAKRRADAAKEMKAEQDSILLDVAQRCMKDDKTLDRLVEMKPDDVGLRLMAPTLKDTSRLFARLGPDFLRDVLANGNVDCKVSDLPMAWQQALCDWRNAIWERTRASYREEGQEPPSYLLKIFTPADMAPSSFKITRISGDSLMPSFGLSVMTPLEGGRSSGSILSWPFRHLSENEARSVAGRDVVKTVLSADPLPDEPKITAEKLRLLGFRRVLLIGDVLDAVARQSDYDVLADYHFRKETMKAFKAVPVRQVVDNVCDTFLYVCRVSGNTLQFRYNKWFIEPMVVEPPGDVIEGLWRTVETKGRLDIRDLLKLAPLTDAQLKWPGFKLMPGGYEIGDRMATLRLWASLSSEEESLARTEAGLPVSQLPREQRSKLDPWVTDMKI